MDHSHMDHSHMDHGDMGHGDMPMPMCSMNMLFTWDTTNLCIVFRQWHIRGNASLIFSLLAIIALSAGYEALREGIRRYETAIAVKQDASPIEPNTESAALLGVGRSSQADAIGRRAHAVKAVLYGVQNFYAFMIMLVFMTYNGFVMLSVAIGAGLGYYFFGSRTKAAKETACH
ncbi:Ctr copper transporter family protein [Annulohypoxylon truncatum]|uniref:Ctr copper transporter family protein n=1 Tax=Annulohypoxylon truncatum TaxID=327061 RepID=UPI002007DF98|nr:Ctr copper transporter family protein [Annulohypoxylon truncatum]KAI1213916.1 Ctr copper transporter family protein [Annulohypoxylon truncatum]